MKTAKKENTLTLKEAIVLKMRDNKSTLEEVGKEIGVTRERVRQIEATARGRKENGYTVPEIPETEDNKPKVELISYSMKMVIPTGNYANIQPEIIVKAGTVEDAHNYIAPHMNKLWKEYYLISERPKQEVKSNVPDAVKVEPKVPPPPASSVAYEKASQAIASCLSMEALGLLTEQIKKSVKLLEDQKPYLIEMILKKQKELNGTK